MVRRLYAAAPLRELERRAVAAGIPGYTLMQRAAAVAWDEIRARWPQAQRLCVLCGPGNNGGDGYVLARLARAAGCRVDVIAIGGAPQRGDAVQAHADWQAAGGHSLAWREDAFDGADLIVDALYGIGLSRPPEGDAAAVIAAMNAARAPVIALDLPSGIDADSGRAPGAAVRARLTVTFIAYKAGLFLDVGGDHAGEIVLHDLGVPAAAHGGLPVSAALQHRDDLAELLPRRARSSHKGSHGHVLVIGGDVGMMGAALLAGRAALRAGAGLVSVATRAVLAPALAAAQPEIMAVGVEDERTLAPLLARADVVLAGPGLGQEAWGRALFAAVLEARRPLVLDADALNLLAQEPVHRADWVLTPHPGEAARLLKTNTAALQADRLATVDALRREYGGIAVLKGAGTLIRGERTRLCPYGNPGMAVGGMGDVLAGVIAALRAQGLAPEAAAGAGVLAHALAGDAAAAAGQRGLLPGDVIDGLRRVLNP